MNLAQIREKFPQYEDISDNDLAQKLHTKFYSDMDFSVFSEKIGLQVEAPTTPPAEESPTITDRVKAAGHDFSSGLLRMFSLLPAAIESKARGKAYVPKIEHLPQTDQGPIQGILAKQFLQPKRLKVQSQFEKDLESSARDVKNTLQGVSEGIRERIPESIKKRRAQPIITEDGFDFTALAEKAAGVIAESIAYGGGIVHLGKSLGGKGASYGAANSIIISGESFNDAQQRTYEKFVEQGIDERTARVIADEAGIEAMKVMAPIAFVTGKMGEGAAAAASGGAFKRALTGAKMGALPEVPEELAQQIAVAQAAGDRTTADQLIETGILSIAAGGTHGAVAGVSGGQAKSDDAKTADTIERISSAETVEDAIAEASDILDESDVADDAGPTLAEQVGQIEDTIQPTDDTIQTPTADEIITPVIDETAGFEQDMARIENDMKSVQRTKDPTIAEVKQRADEDIASFKEQESLEQKALQDVAEFEQKPAGDDRRLDPDRVDRGERRQLQKPEEFLLQRHREKVTEHNLTPEQAEAFAPQIETDPVTGFYTKRDLEPSIKRAQEHTKQTGEHTIYIETDISNMAGGNSVLGTRQFDEQFYTPAAALIRQELESLGGDVIPVRKGGDENGFILANVTEEQASNVMDGVVQKVEDLAKNIGLSEVPHTKNPDLKGVSLYYGLSNISPEVSVSEVLSSADQQVEDSKKVRANVNRSEIEKAGSLSPEGQAGGITESTGQADRGKPQEGVSPQEAQSAVEPGLTDEKVKAAKTEVPAKEQSTTTGKSDVEPTKPMRDGDSGPPTGRETDTKDQDKITSAATELINDLESGQEKAPSNEGVSDSDSVKSKDEKVVEEIKQKFTPEQIRNEIDNIGDKWKKRADEFSSKNPLLARDTAGNRDTDFATKEELERMHHFKLALPTFGDERNQAKKRISERVEKRKADNKKEKPVDELKDFGEKIGGARKDTSTKLGPSNRPKSKTSEPAWRKRFKAMENLADDPGNRGWMLVDTKTGRTLRGPDYRSMKFDSQQDAEKMLPIAAVAEKHYVRTDKDGKHTIWRRIGDRKRVQVVAETFDSNDKAMEYMAKNAEKILETKLSFGEEVLPTPEKVYRHGTERRKGNVEGKDFMDSFGFRGVEFGNWNNQQERQEVMNHAYDALLDMAEIIDVPASALSLNGELSIAFGARGQGLIGAKAHYERTHAVINLTKMSGAGSLAHEWFHALDHYFGRIDGKAAAEMVKNEKGNKVFKTKGPQDFASHGFLFNSKARPELKEAYISLIKNMFRKAETYVEDTVKAENYVGNARDALKQELGRLKKSLEQQLDPKYYKRNNKPASMEQLIRFTELSDMLINGENLELDLRENIGARTKYKSYRHSNDVLDEIGDIYKSVRGRSGFKSDKSGPIDGLRFYIKNYQQRIKTLEDAKGDTKKERNVPTEFLMQAQAADQARTGDYWSSPHEMAARAFAAYVEDKLKASDAGNDFLAYRAHGAVLVPIYPEGFFRPYPEKQERIAINEEFDKLFGVLESKKTDKGIMLYSQESIVPGDEKPIGVNVKAAQKVADSFMDGVKADISIKVVEKQSDVFADSKKRVRAGILNNEVVLIAENLNGKQEAESVLRHEVFGHYGFSLFDSKTRAEIEDKINATRDDPKYKEVWGSVLENYSEANESVQAQEFFAKHAENKQSRLGKFYHEVVNLIQTALRKLGLLEGNITQSELKSLLNIAERQAKEGETSTADSGKAEVRFSKEKTGFSESNRRIREEDKTLWKKAKKYYQRQFMPGGLLPQDVFNEKIKRDSETEVVEFDINHLVGSFEKIVKQNYNKPFENLSRQEKIELQHALVGNISDSIPIPVQQSIVAMRQYIDSLSKEYVGILEQQANELKAQGSAEANAKAQLIEVIQKNIGSYAHRSYRAFDDPKWFKKVPDSVLTTAQKYLRDQYIEQGNTEQEAMRLAEVATNEILKNGTAYDSMESFIKESKLGAKDLTVLKKRKGIAPEIRALLGEYIDPRINFAKSATKMGRLVWNERFLTRIREMGMGNFLFEGKDRPADATTQIAAEGSEAYAPLNGLWTTPEINQAFKDALGKENFSKLYKTIIQLNGLVKYGKTVLSPTTAARNWQSAMFFALANGHYDMRHITKSISGLREYFTNQGEGARLEYLRKLKKLGVVYDTPYAGEMIRLMEDSRIEDLMKSKAAFPYKALRKLNKYATKAYQYGDDFWKVIGFENEKRALTKYMSEAEAEVEAAKRIRDTYPTYSMVGRAMNWLRRFPLAGTFVSFPAEIIRTQANILRYAAKDMKEGRKALAARRLSGQALVAATAYALQGITKAMFGIDDEEEEAIRLLAAPWERNSNLIFTGRDEGGNLQYIDISFLDPYAYFKKPVNAILRDQPWEDSAADVFKETLSPFLGKDIAAGAIFEVLANKKEGTGKEVYNENATPIEITKQIANHIRKPLQPGFVSNLERTWKALKDERSPSGRLYDLGDEGFAWVGWRFRTLDPKTSLYYRSFEFTDDKKSAMKSLTSVIRNVNEVDDSDIKKAYRSAQKQYDQAYREMMLIIKAAKANGMNKRQIVSVLKASKVSEKDILHLMHGKLPPLRVTRQSVTNSIKKAKVVYDTKTAKEILRRYQLVNELSRN